jgi:acetyl-CoA carboxylase carboxyl transferase subunit alpha
VRIKTLKKLFLTTQHIILKYFEELKGLSPKALVEQRMQKYSEMGVYSD